MALFEEVARHPGKRFITADTPWPLLPEWFKQRVIGNIYVCNETDCWIWMGQVTSTARKPFYRVNGDHIRIDKRIAEMYWNLGEFPSNLVQIDTICHMHLCINPAHFSITVNRHAHY